MKVSPQLMNLAPGDVAGRVMGFRRSHRMLNGISERWWVSIWLDMVEGRIR